MFRTAHSRLALLVLFAAAAIPLLTPTPAAAGRVSGKLVPASGAYIGAFVNPTDSMTLSTTDHENLVLQFESMIGRKLDVEMYYYHWGNDFWNGAPKWDLANGRIPEVKYGAGTIPSLDSIINGSQDATLRALADGAKSLGKQFFFCPLWEMNGDWEQWSGANNNDPGTFDGPLKFIKAWRHMHDIFVQRGATNAVWVWAPDKGDNPKVNWNHWLRYYPGDDYVDWVGWDGYNWGTVSSWSNWLSWEQVFQVAYNDFANRKPIMIAETASTEIGGDKAQWIADTAAVLKARYPDVASITWFDDNKPTETDWRVDSSSASLAAFKAWASDPYFNLNGGSVRPSSLALPTISGRPQQGATLTAVNGTWANSPTSFSYQWKRCNGDGGRCVALAGATGPSYVPASGDVGAMLRLFVTAQNASGTGTVASDPVGPVAGSTLTTPVSVVPPVIFGDVVAGQTLSGGIGFWTNAPSSFSYQWKRCDASGANCVSIPGATGSSYTLTASDVGVKLRLTVTASNAAGSGSASPSTWLVSAPAPVASALPTIEGSAAVGQALAASPGTWSGSPSNTLYHWQRCDLAGSSCVDIAGATASTYTITSADVGSTVRVEVTASNADGSAMAASAPTATVTG